MKFILNKTIYTLILIPTLLAGCAGNFSRGLYEGIKTQNEINQTPAERAMNPGPSYDSYSKERESLRKRSTDQEQ